jgi:hypothetical protein
LARDKTHLAILRKEASIQKGLRQWKKTTTELALAFGKPVWFNPQAIVEMRPKLKPRLDDTLWSLFEETVGLFETLEVFPETMVFGHGDIAVYYRAFLFYLMAEVPEENLAHLKTMLQKHLEYYGANLHAP